MMNVKLTLCTENLKEEFNMLKVSFRQVIDMSTLDKMIELVNFKALPVEQLPHAYLTKYPNCYAANYYNGKVPNLVINVDASNMKVLTCGQKIFPTELIEIKSLLEACGNNLYRINRLIRKRKAGWETKTIKTIKF
jgi:hypothetical protein